MQRKYRVTVQKGNNRGAKGKTYIAMYNPVPRQLTRPQLYKLGVYLLLTPYTSLFNVN